MSDTKTHLLDAAARLAQSRGFNGFSFHDLANLVGIKTASIHYHFPTKAHLGQQLVARYTEQFMEALGDPDESTMEDCLSRYAALFRATLDRGHMCLCGIVGAEISGVPDMLAADVQAFFDRNRQWLAQVISRGGNPEAEVQAQVLLAAFEGAMLIARVAGDTARFDTIALMAIKNALPVRC